MLEEDLAQKFRTSRESGLVQLDYLALNPQTGEVYDVPTVYQSAYHRGYRRSQRYPSFTFVNKYGLDCFKKGIINTFLKYTTILKTFDNNYSVLCLPDIKTISELLGVDKRTVQRDRKALIEAGLLAYDAGINAYRLPPRSRSVTPLAFRGHLAVSRMGDYYKLFCHNAGLSCVNTDNTLKYPLYYIHNLIRYADTNNCINTIITSDMLGIASPNKTKRVLQNLINNDFLRTTKTGFMLNPQIASLSSNYYALMDLWDSLCP